MESEGGRAQRLVPGGGARRPREEGFCSWKVGVRKGCGGTGYGSGVNGGSGTACLGAGASWGRWAGGCGLSSRELFQAKTLGAPRVFVCSWPHRSSAQGSHKGLVMQTPLPSTSKTPDPGGGRCLV